MRIKYKLKQLEIEYKGRMQKKKEIFQERFKRKLDKIKAKQELIQREGKQKEIKMK